METIQYTINKEPQPPLILDTQIAKTAGSTVYKSIDPTYGTVAIKVTMEARPNMLIDELKVLKQLQKNKEPHQYYVRTFFCIVSDKAAALIRRLADAISTDLAQNTVVYVMEYIPDTLDEMENLYRKRDYIVEPSVLASYFTDLLLGLQNLHDEYQIAHRDIKPANLVLADGTVKYIDFGYSCYAVSCDDRGTLGTINFIAPEIMISPSRSLSVWIKADIYSLGMTFISIMTSGLRLNDLLKYSHKSMVKALYNGGDAQATIDQLCSKALKRPEHKRFETLIRGMTRVDPKQRMSLAEALDSFDLNLWQQSA